MTELPNQSPARLTAGPVASPTRSRGKSSSRFGGGHQLQGRVEQCRRIGADEHHRIADRLDQPYRADRHLACRVGQPVRQPLKVFGLHDLAQPGEPDDVGERDGDQPRTGQRKPLGPLRKR